MCDPVVFTTIGFSTATAGTLATASTVAGTLLGVASSISALNQGYDQQQYAYEDITNRNQIRTQIAGENLQTSYGQNARKRIEYIEDSSGRKQAVQGQTSRDLATTRTKLGESNISGNSANRLKNQIKRDKAFTNFQIDTDVSRNQKDYEFAQIEAGKGFESDILGLPRPFKPSSTNLGLGIAGEVVSGGVQLADKFGKFNTPKRPVMGNEGFQIEGR